MFCHRCGHWITDSEKFCDECGAEARSMEPPVENKLKKAIIKISVLAAIVVIIIVLFNVFCGGAVNPTVLTEKYMSVIASGDASKIAACYAPDFKKLYMEDPDINDSDDFLDEVDSYYASGYSKSAISEYEISDIDYYDADENNYPSMEQATGLKIKRGARIKVEVEYEQRYRYCDIYLFAVETSRGWYLYKTSYWYY